MDSTRHLFLRVGTMAGPYSHITAAGALLCENRARSGWDTRGTQAACKRFALCALS